MSQERFAEMLEVSVDFLSLIERGRNAPSFETLDRIARRLNVPVSELFRFDGPIVRRSPHPHSAQRSQ
jgi:transcriptional regulator with XRE-family HTH domain